MNSEQILYAMKFCEKYNEHKLNSFLVNDLSCTTEFITPFLLLQYKMENNNRVILSMFFDHELWDKKPSSLKPIKIWFKQYSNRYSCRLSNVPSIRKFIMRLA
jgi:hypothetical protein